jgi:hypothetical protein
MRTTIRLVGTLTPNDLTQTAETVLLQAFRDWKRSSKHHAQSASLRSRRPGIDSRRTTQSC